MIEEADLADELKKWQERRDTLLTDRAVEQGLIELTDDAHHIASVLYPSRNASFGLPMMDPPMDEKRALKSQVMERDDLVVELAKVQDRLNGLQDQLTSAQDEVQDTIRQCQRTYYRLKTQEDPHFRDGADTIKEEEKEELERYAVQDEGWQDCPNRLGLL
ncbi:hypothetical protein BJ684DRAFT_18170 [Piptocephalis cylindrospora]|uniref:Uncharacterized protein n=1 Tax=Piptocephalis cylindrospora TaxID=1907219 RepID=A0A4P9Y9L0_9FUNG|nr:hypothetical protein BJ684DRAFT_18170 [Piptocephalis cylindrospora]|eukprot:RKP15502.1 hypothetical protein BJ684DRAFT_18170 [Piptocephalis cylindrospora]